MRARPDIGLSDYRALAAFRYEIRCFLAFSEQAARAAGIEPQQHQLLLALRGLPAGARPNIRTLAERLCVQHHTTVALVDHLEQRGFVRRERGKLDKREVWVRITGPGARLLRQLSRLHRARLQQVGPELVGALSAIVAGLGSAPPSSTGRRTAQNRAQAGPGVSRPRRQADFYRSRLHPDRAMR